MKHNPQLYNVSLISDSYYRYFEIGLGYFITDGRRSHAYATTYDFKKYESLLGGATDPTLSRNPSKNTYLQGKYYTSFIYNVSLVISDLPEKN